MAFASSESAGSGRTVPFRALDPLGVSCGENGLRRRTAEWIKAISLSSSFRCAIVEDLDMQVEVVRGLGFRVLTHWSGVPAVSEADAHALTSRKKMLNEQHEARRQAEAAEWAARYSVVPAGIPAVEGLSAVEQMFAAGAGDRPKSVREQLLDEELARGKGT